MKIEVIDVEISDYLKKRGLVKKFEKQLKILETNPRHPSLNIELLEPKNRGIYSFRIDRKYRALFIYRDDLEAIEVLAVTDHYQ